MYMQANIYEPPCNQKPRAHNIYTKIQRKEPNITLKKIIKQQRYQRKEREETKKKENEKMAINTYLLIITLKVNVLNTSMKRHRKVEWIQEQDT